MSLRRRVRAIEAEIETLTAERDAAVLAGRVLVVHGNPIIGGLFHGEWATAARVINRIRDEHKIGEE